MAYAATPAPNPALWLAVSKGKTDVARQLLLGGANIEERGQIGYGLCTPLQIAVTANHVKVVQLLLEHGADFSVTCMMLNFSTSLHEAALLDFGSVARLLLQHGADVSARDDFGNTPLDTTARKGLADLAELLLQHGSDVYNKDTDGMTALHWAASCGNEAMVLMLLQHRSNVMAETHAGQTAESLATTNTHHDVVAILQAEAVTRAKCVASAMGNHERLGVGSRVQSLHPEVVRMVLEYV